MRDMGRVKEGKLISLKPPTLKPLSVVDKSHRLVWI